jgi:hypothetical protein
MSLTLYFIVEPPNYQVMACHLAASARMHMPHDVVLIGYCPQHRMDELDPNAVETLRRLRCEVRGFEATGKFDPAYPHGNKLLAALEPKETDFSAFLDSDMLFVRDCAPEELITPGKIGVVPSTSMRWTGQEIWDQAYGAFDMAVPEERMRLTRDKRWAVAPYFNAGLVVIDEKLRNDKGQSFAEVWMETAQTLDAIPDLPGKRPYLDQISLPIAIQRAGAQWHILEERYNYSIGGILRGKQIDPEEHDVTLLHYRNGGVLRESGLSGHVKKVLSAQAGTRRVNCIFLNPPPPGIPPLEEKDDANAKVAEVEKEPGFPSSLPDPSKAMAAAVTTDIGNPEMLSRWVHHMGDVCGLENLYVLSQTADRLPEDMPDAVNVVALPSGDGKIDWQAMSHFTSGLTLYYNWTICTRPDEFLIPAPECKESVLDHVRRISSAPSVPRFLVPIAVRPITAVDRWTEVDGRRHPCLSRTRIQYANDGSGVSPRDVVVDPDILLIDLSGKEYSPGAGGAPQPFDAQHIRQRMNARRHRTSQGFWTFDTGETPEVFDMPENVRSFLKTFQGR